MWKHTGETTESGIVGVILRNVTSEAEGDALEVERRGVVVGRVQEYTATIEAGKGIVKHGPTWAFTPLGTAPQRWAKSRGQTVFGFATRDDAVRFGLR